MNQNPHKIALSRIANMAQDDEDHSFSEEELQELFDESNDGKGKAEDLPDRLPLLTLRNTVLFPGVVLPITVARDKSIQLVLEAFKKGDRQVGVVAQHNPDIEEPEVKDLYDIGTQAKILRLMKMPDGSITIFIQGRRRFKISEFETTEPYFRARVKYLSEKLPSAQQTKAMMRSLKEEATRIIDLSPNLPSEAKMAVANITNLGFLVHFIASNLNTEVDRKQELLAEDSLMRKAEMVLEHLAHEFQVLELTEEIHNRVRSDLDKQQRDYILRQQIRTIQDELGEFSMESEIEEFRKRADAKQWPAVAKETFDKELQKLYRVNPSSPEYAVAINYIETILDLPWEEYTQDSFDLKRARRILDRDHFGLEPVKERILEYLAVLKLKGDMKSPILCFYGPPGVGKTSLGKSIAESLGRQFVRMSLGGVHDEAEIRGHRKTYIGAMPGRILKGLKKAKTGNPVFVLDEIDKLGRDFRGDPSSALLEVLDPEQNNTFNDHYLELDYDLSPVMFIATANSLDSIQPALRDRMEIIEINGYTMEEKVQIAKRHLLPKALKEHGLTKDQMKIGKRELQYVVEGYTRESGVRKLYQQLATLARGIAKDIVYDESIESVTIRLDEVHRYLKLPRFEHEAYQRITTPGVSIGLAWTPVGGEILFIEVALTRGKGQLRLTGQLGEVMKESAQVALVYLKAHAPELGIPHGAFDHWDVNIHIPAGAVPKDGPSAGIALLSAMASAFSQRLVRSHVALTGEITLRGKVLPVGGIKEKLLAAVRSGITTVLLCKQNQKDVQEIDQDLLKNLNVVYVETLQDVLQVVMEDRPIPQPLDLEAPIREAETESRLKKMGA
jgi:ATP-dependent Lon protease